MTTITNKQALEVLEAANVTTEEFETMLSAITEVTDYSASFFAQDMFQNMGIFIDRDHTEHLVFVNNVSHVGTLEMVQDAIFLSGDVTMQRSRAWNEREQELSALCTFQDTSVKVTWLTLFTFFMTVSFTSDRNMQSMMQVMSNFLHWLENGK